MSQNADIQISHYYCTHEKLKIHGLSVDFSLDTRKVLEEEESFSLMV